MVRFDSGPVCAFISGCTRGLGKGIALVLAKELQVGSMVVLLGRTPTKLEETKAEMLQANSGLDIRVYCEYDCSNLDTEKLRVFLGTLDIPSVINDAVVVHNAATFGDATRKSMEVGLQESADYMMTNFASAVATNSLIMGACSGIEKKTIVNITAVPVINNFAGTALYSAENLARRTNVNVVHAGKAARDMYVKVMALEYPDVRILTYAPGFVNTDMLAYVLNDCCDSNLKPQMAGVTPMEPAESAGKLIQILKADKFTSGSTVDYSDEI